MPGSDSQGSPQPAAKPGTACLCCRRRKLKCSREPDGCFNCQKQELPCVYPTIETGVKRKRGPYKKKDRPPREAHLEHVVKYLSNPVAGSAQGEARGQLSRGVGIHDESSSRPSHSPGPTAMAELTQIAPGQTSRSEDLVKDALIALSGANVSNHEPEDEQAHNDCPRNKRPLVVPTPTAQSNTTSLNPSPRLVLDYWHAFVTRVNPLTRFIHCSTFAPKLFALLDDPQPGARQTLAHAIYFAAVTSLSAVEVRQTFGESKEHLLRTYGQAIETTVAQNFDVPEMELMQALLLYSVCARRADLESGQWTLFSLVVRNAQLMRLNEDPSEDYPPLEAELRRRMWWTVCGLEVRRAEEGATRPHSIMTSNIVRLPANLDDRDLLHRAKQMPQSRQGVTEMSFVLLRWKGQELTHHLWDLRRQRSKGCPEEEIRAEQLRLFHSYRTYLYENFLQFCDRSRAWDWMLLELAEVMMTKARLSIEYPWGHTITRSMTPEQRLDMLRSSVTIIRSTHTLHAHECMTDWLWFFRGFVQWHCLAIVVAELAHSTSPRFAKSAWAVLEPLLEFWDQVYKTKHGDAPWDHVNSLIQRSKDVSRQSEQTRARQKMNRPGLPTRISSARLDTNQQPAHRESNAQSQHMTSYPGASEQQIFVGSQPSIVPGHDGDIAFAAQAVSSNSYLDSSLGYSCTSGLADFDVDMGNFDFFPESMDLDALNAVFTSQDWQMAQPMGTFDVDAAY